MNLLKKLLLPALLLLILLLAFLLRSKMVLNGDFYYLVDQSRDLLLAQSIVVDHKLTLIGPRTGIGGIFHGPLWIYMIAPFFVFAKGNPFFTLAPLFMLVSLATVIAGFFVGQRLYGKWVGLLLALLLTLSYPLIQTVPFTTNAQVLPVVFVLYLFAVIQFIRGKEWYFVLALFLTGLGFQFESAFAVLWLPLTVIAAILRQKLPNGKNIVLGLSAFFIGVATFILFDLRHQFLMTSSALRVFFNPIKPLAGYEQYTDVGFRINDRVMSLWNSLLTPLFTKDQLTSGILIVILAIGVGFFLKEFFVKRKFQKYDREYLFLIIAPIFIFGTYIFYSLPLWEHYLLPTSILAALLLTVSMQRIFMKGVGYKIVIGVFLLLATLPALFWVKDHYISAIPYVSQGDGTYKNQLEVAKWVLENTQNKEYGYFVYTPGILTYNMDYLLSWLSTKDKLTAPSNRKHATTYLILYPHFANDDNAYEFWKENVVRTKGKVVQRKQFESGITVEKLAIPSSDPEPDPNYYQNLIFR